MAVFVQHASSRPETTRATKGRVAVGWIVPHIERRLHRGRLRPVEQSPLCIWDDRIDKGEVLTLLQYEVTSRKAPHHRLPVGIRSDLMLIDRASVP